MTVQKVEAYTDSKGNLHANIKRAVASDIETLFGNEDDERGTINLRALGIRLTEEPNLRRDLTAILAQLK